MEAEVATITVVKVSLDLSLPRVNEEMVRFAFA